MPRSSTAIRGEHRTSAGGGFNPALIANLALWLDAGQITGGTDGAGLATWQDKSSNALNLTQATAGAQPTYRTTTLLTPTGKPAVQFAGAAFMASTLSAAPTVSSHFFVANVTSTTTNGAFVGSSVAGGIEIRTNPTSLELLKEFTVSLGTSSAAIAGNAFHVYEVTYDSVSGAVAFYTNGTANGTATSAQALGASTFVLGQNPPAAGEFLKANLAEVLRYDRVLTTGERQQVEAGLKAKHGTP